MRTVALAAGFAAHIDQHAMPGGFVGVDIFFVISGYVIASLLLREREMTGDISVSRFYMRRALRLYPALLVLVLVVTPIAAVYHIGWPVADGLAALSYVTDFWVNGFGPHLQLLMHSWSLAVEEQFYLVWPVLLLFILRRNLPLRVILIGLAVISVLITYGVYSAHIHRLMVIQFLPTSHLTELVAGILLAVGTLHQPKRWLVRLGGLPVALVALGAMVVAEFTLPAHWWAFPFATILCWPPVAHVVLHRESWISAALRFPPVVWLGQRCYAFYLWHYPIIVLLRLQTTLRGWEMAAIALPLTVAFTAVSWRLVETPFLRMKTRFAGLPVAASPLPAQLGPDAANVARTI